MVLWLLSLLSLFLVPSEFARSAVTTGLSVLLAVGVYALNAPSHMGIRFATATNTAHLDFRLSACFYSSLIAGSLRLSASSNLSGIAYMLFGATLLVLERTCDYSFESFLSARRNMEPSHNSCH